MQPPPHSTHNPATTPTLTPAALTPPLLQLNDAAERDLARKDRETADISSALRRERAARERDAESAAKAADKAAAKAVAEAAAGRAATAAAAEARRRADVAEARAREAEQRRAAEAEAAAEAAVEAAAAARRGRERRELEVTKSLGEGGWGRRERGLISCIAVVVRP